jgi:Helix-turn-helix domain
MHTKISTSDLPSRFSFNPDGSPTEAAKGPFGRPASSCGQLKITNRRGPPRAKVFGFGNAKPLTAAIKNQLTAEARRMTRPTEARKHYGLITAKHLAVFRALLWKFHNCVTGWCFPSYEKIADEAGCHRDTVHEAIVALEDAGLLTWDHRIRREHHRVLRTSNGYRFKVPSHLEITKSEIPSGTAGQAVLTLRSAPPTLRAPDNPRLMAALGRFEAAVKA